MKIRMNTTMAGPNGSAMAGQVTDVPEALGNLLIKSREAELVEQAVTAPPENADARPKVRLRGKRNEL